MYFPNYGKAVPIDDDHYKIGLGKDKDENTLNEH